jgi:hypothetical protein
LLDLCIGVYPIERNFGNVTPTRLETVNLSGRASKPPFISWKEKLKYAPPNWSRSIGTTMGMISKLGCWFGRQPFAMGNVVANEARILRRIVAILFESGETHLDRQITPFLARSNGALTDGIEREITQRTLRGNSSPRW